MTNRLNSTLMLDDALSALAVLGRADAEALAVLLECEVVGDDLVCLAEEPAVLESEGEFILAPEYAAEILAALEQDDLPRYRRWHEQALGLLADRLKAGDETVELRLRSVFVRLANRLQTDNPHDLLKLADDIDNLPLTTALSRQWRRYFRAVGLRDLERYDEALAVFGALLETPDLEPMIRGRTLSSRAYCYHLLGRLHEARQGHQQSLELCRRIGQRQYEGNALLNMGIVMYDLHDYEAAETYLRQAEVVFKEVGSRQWLADVYNELGLVKRDRGQWVEALAYFEEYVAYRRSEEAQDRVARGLNNMGEVLLFQGKIQEAIILLEDALAKMTTRVYRIDTYLHLGLAFQALDNLDKAEQMFQQALTLALDIGRRDILAEVHYRLGVCLSQAGDPEAALAQFEAGVAVIEATREPLQDEGVKISLLGRWQQIYEALILYCLALDRPAEAFAWAERARARAFTDVLLAGRLAPEKVGTEAVSPAVASDIQAALPAGYSLLCYFTTGVLDRDIPLLKAIPADNPLRDRLLTPARVLLFVLTPEALAVHECPVDPNALAFASRRRDDRSRFLTPAVLRRLHTMLFKPAGDDLKAKQLHIAPHGLLHHVPFGALVDQQGRPATRPDGPRLVYTPNATVLLRHTLSSPEHLPSSRSCLAVGYEGAQEHALRHTEAEAAFVAQLTQGEAWVGPRAKKEALRLTAGERDWLHFACHGEFNEESPLDSWLEIGAEERLTAAEVLQTWQLQAELVVLSACQSGVSQVLRGDEPMGLVRAFLAAGAKSILVSQWPVEDLPTFLFMRRFYQALQEATRFEPAAALQTAQVWLRRLTVEEVQKAVVDLSAAEFSTLVAGPATDLSPEAQPFARPRHWAAFILVGG